MVAMKRLGTQFQQFDSDSMAMIVLEGEQPLGDEAHHYYDDLVRQLEQDTKHVQHVQNYWGDLITAAGSQSTDGKAAYVQVNLAGNQGETLGNESVEAVREIVERSHPPSGVKTHVTGQSPLTTDMTDAGDKSMVKITVITIAVITMMLLIVYRSAVTTLLVLFVVLIEMSAARGTVAVFGHFGFFGLSTFATSLLTSLAIAAGTDYAIFLIGRYQEARQSGQDREDAYYTAFHGVGHVILGSGLTIAGAMLCLHFTRLNYFSSMGIPSAIGLSVVVLASLTLAPVVAGARQPIRAAGLQAGDQVARMASARDGRSTLAGTDSHRSHRDRARRPARAARLQDELQRPSLHPRKSALHRRLRRSRAAFQRRQDEPRHPACRRRS
jgi:RND superfamily putative drug exporter